MGAARGDTSSVRVQENDWKATVPARDEVATYFLGCLRLVEAGMFEQAETCLLPQRWRGELDLTGVPGDVVHRTEVLSSRARGLVRYGDPDAVTDLVTRIVNLWA